MSVSPFEDGVKVTPFEDGVKVTPFEDGVKVTGKYDNGYEDYSELCVTNVGNKVLSVEAIWPNGSCATNEKEFQMTEESFKEWLKGDSCLCRYLKTVCKFDNVLCCPDDATEPAEVPLKSDCENGVWTPWDSCLFQPYIYRPQFPWLN